MQGLVKHPLDPNRIRQIPRQFGALDRRLVYQAWTRRISLEELALYVFLICVADPEGLSYYSDRRIGQLLNLHPRDIAPLRDRLLQNGLILYRKPLYQVLDLPEAP